LFVGQFGEPVPPNVLVDPLIRVIAWPPMVTVGVPTLTEVLLSKAATM
jgi:hypothetical protein